MDQDINNNNDNDVTETSGFVNDASETAAEIVDNAREAANSILYSDTGEINNLNNVADEHRMYNRTEDHNRLLTADKLIAKTANNMTIAEARTNENPLWTPKTAELERRENEDNK